MNTILLQIGFFNIIIVFVMYYQIRAENLIYEDCRLFSNVLLSCIAILFIDTIGWIIDGNPIYNQIWLTHVIDGLDLIATTFVCYKWVQYAQYIADKFKPKHWYLNFPLLLLILQIILVVTNNFGGFYYYIDSLGIYHRGTLYFIHSIISLLLLIYSSCVCLSRWQKTNDVNEKKELVFIAFIILLPIGGNIFQYYVYGYPTVWLCIVLMILSVYIHIQNKRVNQEKETQNVALQHALTEMKIASQAKTDFMNHMSHDLRTPLNGIIGLTYIMEDDKDLEDIKGQIPELRESAKYLLQLINDILDVNKIESGILELHPTVCDEKKVFDSIIDIIKPDIKNKNLDFSFKTVNIDWTYMLIDEQRVKQIFVNLLNNAIKFTPEGGNIEFLMELVSMNDELIVDRFVVKDSGIGISHDYMSHIFEPFEQENRLFVDSTKGTGLGLPIVKELVELMNGSIHIDSEENVGTTVTLYLSFPIAEKPNNDQPIIINHNDLIGMKVLLCEDHPLNAKIVIKLLEKQGVIVKWASDGKKGVDMFEESDIDDFDIILMDIRMPNMNGLQACEKIRGLDRDDAKRIPIVALTANAYEEDVQKSLLAGMNAHLSKPIEPNVLFDTLTKYKNN